MSLFRTATVLFPPHGGQDRLAVRQFDDRIVADGAGGVGGGARAAQSACDRALQFAQAGPSSAQVWAGRLRALDSELATAGGQATLVVAELWNGQVIGASVGDSQAWLVEPEDTLELTVQQARKPLLGSGAARACGFGPVAMSGRRLLVASDGLFRYAAADQIAARVRSTVLPRLPSLLSDLVRLPNGELQDDAAIVVCEEDADRVGLGRLLAELLPLAREGDSDASLELGRCYEQLDQEEAAAHWFRAAADAGSTEACFDIGMRYAKGRGVTQDYDQANRYYHLGERRGCSLAINNLGYHYEQGDRGLAQDLARALECYQRAAELGANTGQFNLAKAYQFGKFGVAPDLSRAAMLFRAAARQGDDTAMVAWGNCLEKGIGVPVNHAKALAQFRRAMAKGNAEATWRYGLLFELGRGVGRDDRQAVRWYGEAAQRGCAAAQRCLGNMYRWGRGVERDLALASFWLRRAVDEGDAPAVEALDDMANAGHESASQSTGR